MGKELQLPLARLLWKLEQCSFPALLPWMLPAPSSLCSPPLPRVMCTQGCCHPPPAQGIVSAAELDWLPPGSWKLPSEWGLALMNPGQRVNKSHPARMFSCSQDPGDSSLTRDTMSSDPLPARYGTVRLRTVGSQGQERQGASRIPRSL